MSADGTELAITSRIEQEWDTWFPERPRPEPFRLQLLQNRATARLYVLHTGGARPQGVLAKVRVGSNAAQGRRQVAGRPTLTGEPLSEREATVREFWGLQTIAAAVGDQDPGVRPLRPLSMLEEHDAVLMDFVPGRNLRDELVSLSRLVPLRSVTSGTGARDPWHDVGRWLRQYQQATAVDGLVGRQETRDEVVEQFLAYDEFLTRRLGGRLVRGVGRLGADIAQAVLPDRLPAAAGHHDFAPRNVLIGHDDGRLSVIDPLWRWAVPEHEDLCRFLVGMRLLGLQVHTHGVAFDRSTLDRLQRSVVDGYHDGAVPWARLRCYEALILLDKWAALVTKLRAGGLKGRALGLSTRLATRHLAGEAMRVLDAAARDVP